MKFDEWLSAELLDRNMRPADLVRLSGLDSAVVSNLVNGKRNAGVDTATAIAEAFKLPPEEVFRIAGILPPEPPKDQTLQRIDYLYSTLKNEESKQQALQYIEFLKTQEERAEYNVESPRKKTK